MRVDEESRADPAADIVAFDFYSRYQRPTAPQCDRFAAGAAPADAGSGPLLCKRNRLRWCHTDLGSFVLRYRRFVEERQAFGAETRPGNEMEMAPEHSDGLLAGALMAQGWRAARVTDRCLFSHSPSPQACAWQGGTWDDRDMMTWQAGGGVCLESQEDAAWVLANDPNAEMVTVDVSNDGNVVGIPSAAQSALPLQLRCIRRKDYRAEHVWGAAMDWYSEMCADEADLPAIRARQEAKASLEQSAVEIDADPPANVHPEL